MKCMTCYKYAHELHPRYHYKFVLMTHVLLVPDKCKSVFWPNLPLKKFLARFLAGIYTTLPFWKYAEIAIKKIFLAGFLPKFVVY